MTKQTDAASVMLGCLLLLASSAVSVHGVGCRTADGNAVDWWIALKAPEGSAYAYIDSTQKPPMWEYDPHRHLASVSGNPLAETMQQIYGSGAAGYLLYNDQPLLIRPRPRIDADFHAHAKGVLAFKDDQGFWLLHSNPNFPDNPATGSYSGIYDCETAHPDTCGRMYGQQRYAQSYLCMTFDSDNLEKAAQALQIAGVVVMASDVDQDQFPNIAKIVSDYEQHIVGDAPPLENVTQALHTKGGEHLLQIAMSPTDVNNNVYLYEELIQPALKSGLWVETFKEGKDFPSYCPSVPSCLPEDPLFRDLDVWETRTINKIKINSKLHWTNPRSAKGGDHSKWAITHWPGGLDDDDSDAVSSLTTSRRRLAARSAVDACARGPSDVAVVCLSDINRAGHQLQRGGGAVCFTKNAELWDAFCGIVTEVGDCCEM